MTSSSAARLTAAVAAVFAACTPAGDGVCGDGIHDEDEACDDGNADDGDQCTNACLPRCGGVGLVDVLIAIHSPCEDRERWAVALESLSTGVLALNPAADVIGAGALQYASAGFQGPFGLASSEALANQTYGCEASCGSVASGPRFDLRDVDQIAGLGCLLKQMGIRSGHSIPLCMLVEPFHHPRPGEPIDTGEFGRPGAVRAFIATADLADCSVFWEDVVDGTDCFPWRGFGGLGCVYPWQFPELADTEQRVWSMFREALTGTEPAFFAAFVGMDADGRSDGRPTKGYERLDVCTSPNGVPATPDPRLTTMAAEFGEVNSYLASYCDEDVAAHFYEIGRRLGALSLPCPPKQPISEGMGCSIARVRDGRGAPTTILLVLLVAAIGIRRRRRSRASVGFDDIDFSR